MSSHTTWKLTTTQRNALPKLYRSGMSIVAIGRRFHVSPAAVYTLLLRRHEPIRSFRESHLRFHCDETFFDCITSDQQAYWLGFLWADGTVGRGRDVCLSLQSRDVPHLHRLRRALRASHPVRYYRYGRLKFCRLAITSPHLVTALAHYGLVTPRKPRLPRLPHKWHGAFVRGYFDGDGSITIYKRHRKKEAQVTISARYTSAQRLRLLLETHEIHATLQRDHRIWRVSITARQAIRQMRTWIYHGASDYLPRKRKRFFEIH